MAKFKTNTIYSENAVAEDDTGSAVGGFNQIYALAATVTAANETGTATYDVSIEHSFDNSTWIELIAFTQISAAGSETKFVSEYQGTAAVIGRFLRAVVDVTGTGSMDLDVVVYSKY